MAGAVKKAEELHAAAPGSIIAGQFENPANAQAHYETTGPEIWDDTEGKVDIFVAGIGTGGTITGTGRYLKEKRPSIRVIGVEPAASPLLTEGKAGPHGLQGIGANFVPELLDRGLLDGVMAVADEDAFRTAKELVRAEGSSAASPPARPSGRRSSWRKSRKTRKDDRRAAAGQRRPVPVGGGLRLTVSIHFSLYAALRGAYFYALLPNISVNNRLLIDIPAKSP